MIRNLDDLRLTLRDGLSSTQFHLDFNRRLYLTGYDGADPMHCTTHGLEQIRQIHDLTGAIIAALEGEK
ncbi:hypothetical protein IU487_22130 [Nocardia puris]|uniref:Uncharacterized protein n=1 Tax=Nocardia puris TaxID=208602 RepID=A0A366CWW3_9NOCA|nr:hypothetical protein [Nocardia puris]MBF6213718.1 hypothetical protein [Nocardia puris]RBO82105.1 hypothetical protein DFR74_12560 [Nocardia puris]